MPNYDYYCSECGYQEEILQKITDNCLTQCPQCQKQTLKRKIGGGIGLQFKGSGFYQTDYGSTSVPEKEGSPSSTTSETSATEAKKGCCCNKPSCKKH